MFGILCLLSDFPKTKKRAAASVEDRLVELQQQTLAAVNHLADIQQQQLDIQRQLLETKKAKLELQREMILMEKAKMMTKGWFQDEKGNWVGLVQNSGEE